MTAATRQHKRRARVKHGIEVWDIPVRADHVIGALMATVPPRLTEEQALNPRRVRAAVAKLLDDLGKIARKNHA